MSEEAAAARAAEVERLALELEALKEKHATESRLEACLLELDAARKAAGVASASAAAALHGQSSGRSSEASAEAGGETDADAAAARAAEVDRLAHELVALKEKHRAGSRLEACLLELDEVRKRAAAAQASQPVVAAGAADEANDAHAAAAEVAAAEAEAAARAAEVDRLSHELVALKEKHRASSRLEACLLELEEVRNSKVALEEELRAVKEQLGAK